MIVNEDFQRDEYVQTVVCECLEGLGSEIGEANDRIINHPR